jgi:hypothetical protein
MPMARTAWPVRARIPNSGCRAMKRVLSTVLHEARRMLPPTLFFLVCLNLLVLTVTLLSDDHEVSAVSHAVASVGALLIGKAVLLSDMLPFVDRHRGRPLIYATLWKASLYLAVAMTLHLLERLFSLATGSPGLVAGAEDAARQIDWAHFLVVQMWLAILFLIFVAFRETVREIGPARFYGLFFVAAPQPASGEARRGLET